MTTLLPRLPNIHRIYLSIFFLLFISSQTIWGQSIQLGLDKSNGDSTQIRVTDFPDVTPPAKDSAIDAHFKHFWILGNGNFVSNTRSESIYEQFYDNSTSPNTYHSAVRVYSTSIYVGKGDEPPKMVLSDTITVDTTTTNPIAQTKAVKSDYLNLQFNHKVIVPLDTTLWVLSIKRPTPTAVDPDGNTAPFKGEVYLFFNSPIKAYPPTIQQDPVKGLVRLNEDIPSEPIFEKDNTGRNRFPNFKYNTTFLYGNRFFPTTFDVSGAAPSNSTVDEVYKNGLLWHFDMPANEDEQHLFIEFQDADNIFEKGDTSTRYVNFLAVLVANDTTIAVADSMTVKETALISSLNLNEFTSFISNSLSNNEPGENIVPNPINSGFDDPINNRIIDVFSLETRVRRAHDPNILTVQTCGCPPDSDGAQKLILTVEFENDGEAATTSVEVRIPIPPQIDAASISGDILSFHVPGLEKKDIGYSLSADNKTMIWTFDKLVLQGSKSLKPGNPLTFAEFTFTALTNKGTDINDLPEMHACIFFWDKVGDLPPICTKPSRPELLTQSQSETKGVQGLLSCQECKSGDTCNFPIWLICLIVAVVLFAMWIGLYKEED